MKNIGILAVALVAALVLGFGARIGTPTAHAQVTGTAVIGCEFLAGAIDGNIDDTNPIPPADADFVAACTGGLSAAEIDSIAGDCDGDNIAGEAAAVCVTGSGATVEKGIGDNDGKLELSDLEDLDLDGNQIADGGGSPATYAIAFVNNDGTVTFDSQVGLTVAVSASGDAATDPVVAVDDLNSETCGVNEGLDFDCGNTILSNGDGVVVAALTEVSTAGSSIDVNISQSGGDVSTESISIVGTAKDVAIASFKLAIQTSGTSTLANTCINQADVNNSSQLSEPNKTFVEATVTDNAGRELTRVTVGFTTDSATVSRIDDDSGETGADPIGKTPISVDSGTAAGVGAFAVVCGGPGTGTAKITAKINATLLNEDTDSVEIEVVGVPDDVALTASPAAIDCNGTQTATVTATVTDADGNVVADGTNVNFAVVALGTANPINVDTVDGAASSTITPLSTSTAGVTVIVTSGSAQSSIRVDCNIAAAATATPGAGTGPGSGPIGGPDTGNGGYLGQDSSTGLSLWTLVALALGSMALVGGGMVTRRAGK